MCRSLVRTILERPDVHPWRFQNAGVLGLWLDPGRRHRLHLWDPGSVTREVPIHDHPLHFTSSVMAGEVTNTRYEIDPAGETYLRDRHVVGDEERRSTDTVKLTGTSTTYGPGQSYSEAALDLHSSAQLPGTVTLLRFTFVDVPVLTTCRRPGTPWLSGASRQAEPDEVERFTALALGLLE